MNSPEHKRGRWPKGVSGNPKGRPRRNMCLTDALRSLATRTAIGPDGRKAMRVQLLGRLAWARALEGDYRFVALLFDRLEGKVPGPLERPDPTPRIIFSPLKWPHIEKEQLPPLASHDSTAVDGSSGQ